jgi:hypothetical protein
MYVKFLSQASYLLYSYAEFFYPQLFFYIEHFIYTSSSDSLSINASEIFKASVRRAASVC